MSLTTRFKKIPYLVQYFYAKVTGSISFIPTLMAIAAIITVWFMIYLERNGLTSWATEHLPPYLLIKSWDVSQAILTTMIGALISLMVFSFSMVMVLLNNAASNYSPRILPGLVADRFHQFVLGTYIFTIIYCIILVINMTPTQDKIGLPSFSVLLAIVLSINCLMLFVLFIHSISETVQVGKILTTLYVNTYDKMEEILNGEQSDEALPHQSSRWESYSTDRSGHLRSIDIKDLHDLCAEENIRIRMLVHESRFVLDGSPLFAADTKLEEEVLESVLKKFIINTNGVSTSDYIVGFKFITEIALKAMSPGINDPGTALAALDYLTILFNKKMELPEHGAIQMKTIEGKLLPTRIWLNVVDFDNLLTFVLAPFRQYSKHDLMVMLKMLEMLKFLVSRTYCSEAQREVIVREALVLKEDAEEHLTNSADVKRALDLVNKIVSNKGRTRT